ncbi:hypothetical protein [Bacillus sp. Hm123]|uniref:hypothetical protein n=1 Tax=Bacillus sp. Hm123 TaxID=3450745 RepID=UPI003F43896A
MKEYNKCPKCGNKQLLIDVEEVVRRYYSVKTGRLVRDKGVIHINAWIYMCRCGWYSEATAYPESPPDILGFN